MKGKTLALIGTWQDFKAAPYKKILEDFGATAAKDGWRIVCGAGSTGIFPIALDAYKKNNGKKITVFLPKLSTMKRVGEKKYLGADSYVATNAAYPIRNALMVDKADALVVISGGLGSLGEIIAGAKDFGKPVFIYNSSKVKKVVPDAYDFVQGIGELKKMVKFFTNIGQLQKLLLSK